MNFRSVAILFLLLLSASAAYAVPCAGLKSNQDHWVTAQVDALILAARRAYETEEALPAYNRVLDGIANTLERCRFTQDKGFLSRYPKFVEYIAALSIDRQPDHELGFVVPDKQYFAETFPYVQIPEFLLDQNFLRVVSRYETLDRAKSFLQVLNSKRGPSDQLIFFSYTSRHLGTPDNDDSYRRLLVVVPGNADEGVPEKWVQFGVTDPGVRTRTRNVSVVSALPGPGGTSNIYFKDFFRTYRRDGSISINGRWELGHGDDNCVQCHKSGILPIFPEKGSVNANEQQAVLAVNQRFLTYGPPNFGKYLDPGKFGPGLSDASWDDRRQRFGAGFSETVVGRAMTCGACHHQERLGSFNWPMDSVVISSFVKGGQMPLGYALQPAARSELYAKLVQEYFSTDAAHPGILKSWLLGKPL
ncbi:MAG: hypothetical protein ABI923_02110 [bacterium]